MKVAQDTQRFSNLVKYEQYPEFAHCRDEIKYNGKAKDFAIGDLVAADGTVPTTAANIAGIVLHNKSAEASTDTTIIVLSRGAAGVSEAGLNLGALTIADVKAQLLSVGIKVLTAI